MINHEPINEREKWEEREAVKCERMIDEIKKSVVTYIDRLSDKTQRPCIDYLHLTTGPLHECAVRINAYAQMADNFRRGRWARIESEQYREIAK